MIEFAGLGLAANLAIFAAAAVAVWIDAHREAGVGRRRGNQLDDRVIATQRLASPVLTVREQEQTMHPTYRQSTLRRG